MGRKALGNKQPKSRRDVTYNALPDLPSIVAARILSHGKPIYPTNNFFSFSSLLIPGWTGQLTLKILYKPYDL